MEVREVGRRMDFTLWFGKDKTGVLSSQIPKYLYLEPVLQLFHKEEIHGVLKENSATCQIS